MGRRGRIALGSLGLWIASGCTPTPRGASLELLGFRQNGFQGVALNEELVFYFSEELDRSSITDESVRIQDERGKLARGSLRVRRGVLSFLPDLPRAPDLSDGGLRPGTGYSAILGGFPRPDGIRSREGALLSATLILSFRTAEREGPHPLFLSFSGPKPLLPVALELGPEDPIRLECREALNPATVSAGDFELRPHRGPLLRDPLHRDKGETEPVPLEAVLAVNTRERAVLELRARPGSLEPDLYYLYMPGRGLRTLGDRSVEPGWRPFLRLNVRLGRFEEDFTRTRFLAQEAPAGCDGTALPIAGQKGVGVRYPAAAGSGEDGSVELSGDLPHSGVDEESPGSRIQAVRITVPAGATVNLGEIEGPVVLCSQTSIVIRGRLERRGAKPAPERLDLQNPRILEWQLERLSRSSPADWPTLSGWLERALPPGEPWTILIAGGDLLVPEGGGVDVDGPLMLIAGGWIRVDGHVDAREVWKTPEARGNIAGHPPSRPGGIPAPGVRDVPLVIDPPGINRLRAPLCVGVLSLPIPARVERWRPAILEAHDGIGRVRVRFLGRRGSEELGPWEELSRLEGCSEVRFLAELVLPAGNGEPWDPPTLRRIELSWSEPLIPAERSGDAPP